MAEWPGSGGPAHVLGDLGADPEAVALTVDDGPHPLWTPELLDLLARHEIRATFFLIGSEVRAHPELARRIVAEGHSVGNHTMHHPQSFAALPETLLEKEVVDAQRCIEDVTGVAATWFRAPYGDWSPLVLRRLHAHGLRGVDWSVDPEDWSEPGAEHVARVVGGSRPGDIVLCHDGGGDRSGTVAALREVLPVLRDRGTRFTAL
ncbi:chitooligosaccharide deacetylase NodB [Lentzea pudingi]|uniref:Chitooligosaccharide deacetylase NodB n=1 Tax=Lentzea pudingi TaxID=1789439 RepID=A0ABQ2I1V2_9PSEU|nr:polysaccharide deacetylase family protein [Lentzea pudingi]GGM97849.1 chitooligosaccharide deacetylase NodB [Lentzea pudingi]